MRVTVGGYQVDDDPDRIDPAAAAEFLTTEAYWARWRGEQDIRRQIATAWRVVGCYDQAGAMVGFARAFGDGGSAYLADVYVLPGHRGVGLGRAIVRMMVEQGPGQGLRWMLHTSDAHGLYRDFGFLPPGTRYLERPSPAEAPEPERKASIHAPLVGKVVRLEPLRHQHVTGLLAAASGGEDLYRWTTVPQDEAGMRRYVETAAAARDSGTAEPFAVIRAADDAVIGSTRFFDLAFWPWPEPRDTPDTAEIGYTWLSRSAIRTGVNTEMKRLMLGHAFETWQVRSVCLHTDVRNRRSREAMERMGARFEGILRAHRLGSDGGPRDSARFAVTAADWPAVRRHLDELIADHAERENRLRSRVDRAGRASRRRRC